MSSSKKLQTMLSGSSNNLFITHLEGLYSREAYRADSYYVLLIMLLCGGTNTIEKN